MDQKIYELSNKFNYMMTVQGSDKERFRDVLSWAGDMIDLTIKSRLTDGLVPKRAEVWTCNLGENVGSELNKVRPVIITSNDIGNLRSPIITIIPISQRKDSLPTQVGLLPSDFSFMESSITGTSLAEQIKVVSKARLGKRIGVLNNTAMTKIDLSVLVSLGMIGEIV